MAIDPSVYRGIDTQFGQRLSDLINPASIRQRQRAEEEQNMANQLRQMQVMQGVQQMRRAPVLAQREEQQYQAQQADAMRKQQEQARRQEMLAQLPEDQRRMLELGVSPKDVLIPDQPKPSDLLARERFEWEKRQKLAGGGAGKLQFSESQGGFIEPPSAQFPQGRIIPVPGVKPKGEDKLRQMEEKEQKRTKNAISRAGLVIDTVDDALSKTGFFTTGLTGATLGVLPGTSAYDLRRTVDTVKANIGFSELQAMREASPTGGALGQVAVQELAMLQAVLGSLEANQSEPELRKKLEQVKTHYENWKKTVSQGGGVGEPELVNDDAAAIEWAQANPNDPRAAQIMSLHGR